MGEECTMKGVYSILATYIVLSLETDVPFLFPTSQRKFFIPVGGGGYSRHFGIGLCLEGY